MQAVQAEDKDSQPRMDESEEIGLIDHDGRKWEFTYEEALIKFGRGRYQVLLVGKLNKAFRCLVLELGRPELRTFL